MGSYGCVIVDADQPSFEMRSNLVCEMQIARPHRRRKAIARRIGHCDQPFQIILIKRNSEQNRTENLFLCGAGGRVFMDQQGRFDKIGWPVDHKPTKQQLGTCGSRMFDLGGRNGGPERWV